MAVLDFGFCIYGLIATQNAARIGAIWGSANSTNAQSASFTSTACTYALAELQNAPNMGATVTTCGGTSPVSVTASYLASGADQLPAVTVAVTYRVSLLAIPGIMPASLSILRRVQLPVRN
jgi:hypothetical protein